jgi:glycosyltransferase involved in cell wall biosynthesis
LTAKWVTRGGEGDQGDAEQPAGTAAGLQQPLVSVLVPTWNYRAFLAPCLDSVIAQTYAHIEVVVLDDCSSDGSLEIAHLAATRDPRITVTRNPKNLGAFGNSLRCLELVSGEAVMFVGADDVLRPDAVERLVSALGRSPATVLSFGAFEQIDHLGATAARQPPPWLWQPARPVWAGQSVGDEMLRRCRNLIGSPTAVMFRKDALTDPTALPGFSPGRQPLFDLLWWLRILRNGDVARIGAVVSDRRLHRSSTTSSVGTHALLVNAWGTLLRYAIDIGYLRDPASEAEAWSSFLLLNAGLLARPAHWRGSSRFAHSLASNASRATRRLSDLGATTRSNPTLTSRT